MTHRKLGSTSQSADEQTKNYRLYRRVRYIQCRYHVRAMAKNIKCPAKSPSLWDNDVNEHEFKGTGVWGGALKTGTMLIASGSDVYHFFICIYRSEPVTH